MEDVAITSAQVIFPDKMTLDEKMSAALKVIESLQERISKLEAAATTDA